MNSSNVSAARSRGRSARTHGPIARFLGSGDELAALIKPFVLLDYVALPTSHTGTHALHEAWRLDDRRSRFSLRFFVSHHFPC